MRSQEVQRELPTENVPFLNSSRFARALEFEEEILLREFF